METDPNKLKADRQKSKDIDKQLTKEERRRKNELVLLMLGPGGSGKSTFCKQMKILHMFGFTENEKEKFRWVIHTNIVDAICTLVEAAFRQSYFKFGDETKQNGVGGSNGKTGAEHDVCKLGNLLLKRYRGIKYDKKTNNFISVERAIFPQEIQVDGVYAQVWSLDEKSGEDISNIWNDENIKAMFDKRMDHHIMIDDSALYYLSQLDRIVKENYVPNDIDILRARLKTTSVVETTFAWDGSYFRIVDVGGQKGERKKWLPLFSGVTAVIFCIGLSDFDLPMEEDPQTNRMADALEVFKDVANSKYLEKTPIILFLNKKDLFEEKIKKSDLSVCFTDYSGGRHYDAAFKFIQKKFQDVNPDKKVFMQPTIATDTKTITTVWKAVREILLGQVFDKAGIPM